MSNDRDSLTDPLNAWLEAGMPRVSGNGADPDLASLQAAARCFHDLARRGERFAATDSPLPSRWEDLMAANTISAWTNSRPSTRFGRAAVLSEAQPSRRITPPVARTSRRNPPSRLVRFAARWQPAISLAVVVAFLASLVGIAWQRGVPDDTGSGPGTFGNQPTIPFRGSVDQDDLKLGIDPADLPTVEDCTVEPLTVDEVIAILEDPDPSTGWFSEDEVGTGDHPTQVTIDAAAETLHTWNACHMAGSDFQRWALETPASVQREVRNRLPRLTGEKEARRILGEVRDTGESADFAPPPWTWSSDYMPLIDRNPEHSWLVPDTYLIVGLVYYDSEGDWLSSRPVQETVQYARATGKYTTGACYTITMGQSEDRTTWLVNEGVPGCG